MPKAIKVKQVEIEPSADLQETISGLRDRLKDKQKTLTQIAIAVLGVIVAMLAIFVYYNYITSTSNELLSEGQAIYYGMKPIANPTERLQKSLELFKKAYDTKSSSTALLYIANTQAELGNLEEAIKTLIDMKLKYSNSPDVSMASLKLAYLYIKKGDLESAIKAFNDVSAITNGPFVDLALYESAQLLKSQGKTTEAEAKLKELAEKFPKSSFAAKSPISMPSDNKTR